MIIRKKQQAPALFVQTDLDDAVVQSIAYRVWGNARASEINVIFFQRSNGILIEKSRKYKRSIKCQKWLASVGM